jgi:hypothetical protein
MIPIRSFRKPIANARLTVAAMAITATMCLSAASGCARPLCGGTEILLEIDPAATGFVPFAPFSLAGRRGIFLIDTGATSSSVDAVAFDQQVGSRAELKEFSFPGVDRGYFDIINLTPSRRNRQIGISASIF